MLTFDSIQSALAVGLAPIVLYVVYAWLKAIGGAFFGPLSKIPGPKLWAMSRLPRMYMEWQGEEAAGVDALHKKYGPVVRLAPNEVSFAGGAQAWVRLRDRTCPQPFPSRADMVDFHVLPYRQTFMAIERMSVKRNTHTARRRRIGPRSMEPRP